MPAFICSACGLQYPNSEVPPQVCVVCQDERLHLPPGGQAWTTMAALRDTHFNAFRRHEPGLMGLGTHPAFAFGQRALLLRTPAGNILWDCLSFLDDATTALIGALGGISAIAVSHPHHYAAMVDWSHAFGSVPIYVHATDRKFVVRPDSGVIFWEDDVFEITPGVTLLRGGGHFGGSALLHWAQGGGGRGALLTSDTIRVGQDGHVSFMRSYANLIPLDANTVQRMSDLLSPWPFAVMYGSHWDSIIPQGAAGVFARSVQRYLTAIDEQQFGWSNL